jgi:peptide/nickel transport system substrate-binding protein
MHRGTRSRLSVAAIALIALALLGAGCGSGGSDDGGGSTTASGKRGGTLTITQGYFPTTLDAGRGEAGDYNDLVYDPLIVWESDGSFGPGLALSWEYGPRNMSFSIKLRPNVTFSDGAKLDAQAVKTWLEYAKSFPGGFGGQWLSHLKTIEITGPLSLTLHFKRPTPLLELVFSQALSIGSVGSPRAVAARTLKNDPVGAGPYMLDKAETVPRDHYTYVPNPRYWNPSAIHWSKVVIKTITNPSAALQALKTGQVQVVKDQEISSALAAKSAGLEFVAPATLVMALQLSDRGGRLLKPLGDLRVRQAINYGIDREAIAQLLGQGHAEVTDQFAANGDDAYDPDLKGRYPYDPAKARSLLAEAGYADGFTLPVMAIRGAGNDKLAQAVAGQLARVGITVKPEITTTATDYLNAVRGAKFPAVVLGWGRLPAVTQYQLLWGPDAVQWNAFKSQDPRLDALYAELIAAPPEQADAVARKMQRFLVEQAWYAPVVVTPLAHLHSKDVAGVTATPERVVPYVREIRPAG